MSRMMRLNLNSKRAVVTGANRDIGLATVEALIREGAEVVGVDLLVNNVEGADPAGMGSSTTTRNCTPSSRST